MQSFTLFFRITMAMAALLVFASIWSAILTSRRNSDKFELYNEVIRSILRARLDSVLLDFQLYEESMRNTSKPARATEDLIPVYGGTPKRVVVVAGWRFGSTFLGNILKSHPGMFYHYEPLLMYGYSTIRSGEEPIRLLDELMSCNYSGKNEYLETGRRNLWQMKENAVLETACLALPDFCLHPRFLEMYCRLFPLQLAKTTRLRLQPVEPLIDNQRNDTKVVLLVRDPRAVWQSRRSLPWCIRSADCIQPSRICADLVEDYGAALLLSHKYPENFRVIRFEDLSKNPRKVTEDMMGFLDLQVHPKVKVYLTSHTTENIGKSVLSTFRKSESVALHWRQELSFQEVQQIQASCGSAMKLWGYVKAMNETHMHKFNPVGKFRLE